MVDFTEALAKALVEYYKTGAHKTQRFGQYFINYYLPAEYSPWPELFYERDNDKAMQVLIGRFALDNVKALE